MRRHRPFRLVLESPMLRVPNPPGMVGTELGGQAHVVVDRLECGHQLPRPLLVPPSRSPHVRAGGAEYRRCPDCPRVGASDAGIPE